MDGPGNRTSIFFQGCPFNCLFCHNPETIHMCCGCGACVAKCPAGALKMEEGQVLWDSTRCVQCDTCIRVCPHDASPKIRWMTVEEILYEVRRSAPYIVGITTSGGECTLAVRGDLNSNGAVNSADVKALMEHFASGTELSAGVSAAADFNSDGAVDNRDLVLLAQSIG